jgi:hypothetical protein
VRISRDVEHFIDLVEEVIDLDPQRTAAAVDHTVDPVSIRIVRGPRHGDLRVVGHAEAAPCEPTLFRPFATLPTKPNLDEVVFSPGNNVPVSGRKDKDPVIRVLCRMSGQSAPSRGLPRPNILLTPSADDEPGTAVPPAQESPMMQARERWRRRLHSTGQVLHW